MVLVKTRLLIAIDILDSGYATFRRKNNMGARKRYFEGISYIDITDSGLGALVGTESDLY